MDGLLAAKIYPPRPTGTPPKRGFLWEPFLAEGFGRDIRTI